MDATRVIDVLETLEDRAAREVSRVDLGARLGISDDDAGMRRSLLVRRDEGPYVLIVGRTIRMLSIPFGELQQLPPLLAGLHERVGIMGLVRVFGGLGYLLDTNRLGQGTP